VWLRARFGAPLTGLNSPAEFMLLTVICDKQDINNVKYKNEIN
jgi:hypothetical protein